MHVDQLSGSSRPGAVGRAIRTSLLILATLAVTFLLGAARPMGVAHGAPVLDVEVITWDVIGLDSNRPAEGPATYPVGVRVCNQGTSDATDVAASLVWDSSNPYVALIGDATLRAPRIAPGGCTDLYFNVSVVRDKAAFDTARRYHVDVFEAGRFAASTTQPRELFVEKLVSQNRNSITAISGPGGIGPTGVVDPPTTDVVVGETYEYQLHGKTATNGYEQLETFIDFPNVMFQILAVSATYSAPPSATNDSVYADACGWDWDPTSPTYRSCIGPTSYAGKAGGNIVIRYRVLIRSVGTATVTGLIYDFSGSSYHYNSDHGTPIASLTITATEPPPTTTTTTVPPVTTTVPPVTTTVPPVTTTVPPVTTTTVPPVTTTVPPVTTTVPPVTTTTTVPPVTTTTTTTVPPVTTTVPPVTTTVPPVTTTTTVPPVTTTVPPVTTTTVPPATTTTVPFFDGLLPVPPDVAPSTTDPASPTTTVPLPSPVQVNSSELPRTGGGSLTATWSLLAGCLVVAGGLLRRSSRQRG